MNEKKTINRRQALKTLVAVTGAVSLASLPAWEKPVIEVGALPAHAQNSGTNIRAINNTGEDLESVSLKGPDGQTIGNYVSIDDGDSYTWMGLAPINNTTSPGVQGSACYSVTYPVVTCDNSNVEGADIIPFPALESEDVCTLASGTTEVVTLSCVSH